MYHTKESRYKEGTFYLRLCFVLFRLFIVLSLLQGSRKLLIERENCVPDNRMFQAREITRKREETVGHPFLPGHVREGG